MRWSNKNMQTHIHPDSQNLFVPAFLQLLASDQEQERTAAAVNVWVNFHEQFASHELTPQECKADTLFIGTVSCPQVIPSYLTNSHQDDS